MLARQAMDTAAEVTLQALGANPTGVLAGRYLTVAGTTLLVYDNILTLGDEIRLVWRRAIGAIKLLFLFTRYSVLGTMLLVTCVTSGHSTHTTPLNSVSCHRWILVVGVSMLISTVSVNLILIIRVYALYDHRKNILRILLFACALTFVVMFFFGALTLREVEESIMWEPHVYRTCILIWHPKSLVGFWSPQVAFELFTFLLTLVNAAERPRRAQSKLITDLIRDGFLYMFVLFWLRVMNMIFSAVPDLSFNLLASFFSWAITVLTLARLVLRVENMRDRASTPSDYSDVLQLSRQKKTRSRLAPGGELPFITVDTETTTTVI